MTMVLIIAYIASVFVSRWLNRIAYWIDDDIPCPWFMWLIPFLNLFIGVLAISLAYFHNKTYYKPKFIKWFIGDNW